MSADPSHICGHHVERVGHHAFCDTPEAKWAYARAMQDALAAVANAVRPLGAYGGATDSPWNQGYTQALHEAEAALIARLDIARRNRDAAASDGAPYVIDRHAVVWRVVRDGGMATRADYAGITTIGIVRLEQEAGPLIPFHPLAYLLRDPSQTSTAVDALPADRAPEVSAPSTAVPPDFAASAPDRAADVASTTTHQHPPAGGET